MSVKVEKSKDGREFLVSDGEYGIYLTRSEARRLRDGLTRVLGDEIPQRTQRIINKALALNAGPYLLPVSMEPLCDAEEHEEMVNDAYFDPAVENLARAVTPKELSRLTPRGQDSPDADPAREQLIAQAWRIA